MTNSRTNNSIRNSLTIVICRLISIIFSFVIRTVFINYLGKSILGIEGLFSNIISILNLADLGVSTAVIFLMYKPIAEGNNRKTSAILNYLNKFYFIVGFVILGVGIAITPLVPHLINLESEIEHLNLYYILTILSTSMTYFFASRRCIYEATQNNYIVTITDTIFSIIGSIIKLVILLTTGNYAIYLAITILITLFTNIVIFLLGNKKFPYLKEYSKERMDKTEKKELYKNVTAVMSHKIGTVLVTGTDNLLISVMLNTILVGIYSNYLLIINMIMSLVTIAISAITPSVGNLKESSQNPDNDFMIYKQINFITFWIVAMTAICLFCLLNPFITTWLDSSFLFDWKVVLLLCVNYYISTMRYGIGVFATAAGYFKKTWYKPYCEGIINLIFSILLAPSLGVAGIFLGTTLSLVLGSVWIDPVVTYKNWFKRSPKNYFLNYILEIVVVSIIGGVCYYITNLINFNINPWFNLIIQGIVCFLLVNILLLLILFRKKEFKEIFQKIKKIRVK